MRSSSRGGLWSRTDLCRLSSSTRRATYTPWTTAAHTWGSPCIAGTIEDGILTCHWHHARFDLKSGCTFDLFADDATVYPVEVVDGRVYIDVSATPCAPVERGLRRLEEGMDQNIRLVVAKAVVALIRAGANPNDIVRGKRPVRSAPAAFGLVKRHDDPLGDGQRQRPSRRRRAHRAVVPRGPYTWRRTPAVSRRESRCGLSRARLSRTPR